MSAPGFGRESTALEVIAGHDLTGRETIVTGGASGLGYETARALASAGARVVIAGRDETKGRRAVEELRERTGNDRIVHRHLDLASLTSVTRWANGHAATGKPLHVLVLNAGVMATPPLRTADGFELQWGVNHLGHFAFTLGLLPSLRAAGTARVVVLSSRAHRRSDVHFDDPNYDDRPYDPWESYGQSKTANALFGVALTHRHGECGITANAVMPGAIRTGLQRHMSQEELAARGWDTATPPGWKTPEQGAATIIWAAVAPELDGVGGRLLDDCAIAEPWTADDDPPLGTYLPYALDPVNADRLWNLSERLLTAAGVPAPR
ncbi:SDR family NAD(P)-dependent oxidoreductase [Actinoallomurus rhizosphaericola]|uniref:SDR family NAD(P)-dependent oxidoreductase n=1 Tax=Actinoallomurus rhizosphaericola TaxID=2952536 RepID=UPI0020910411|nr:SDR family NAD(P)-dependent oxidoreductase [Actinoallomurus rhizosphaericola]MCO5993840.1 SDR family NAD(P)-dependent oxidoreductase [Actinoallomurus rhizosphaericola]